MSDLISRRTLIEFANNSTVGIDANDIERFPSAQQWIPCAERLPTKAGHYLCSFKKPNRIDRIHVDLAYWTGSRWCGYMGDEINAWLPLPEPYKGVQQ